MKRSILFAGPVALALIGGPVWAEADPYGYGGHMMDGYFGHWMFGGPMMILFWVGIIALVVLAIRWLTQNGGRETHTTALGILQERLARGEIDSNEYQARKITLEA